MIFSMFKKQSTKVKEDQTSDNKNVMYDRVERLLNNITYAPSAKENLFEVKVNTWSLQTQTCQVHVNTALGWRDYTFYRFYGFNSNVITYEVTLKNVFELSVVANEYSSTIEVQPLLGENLKAKDIDLAILELENIFSGYYQDHQKVWNRHQEELNKLREGITE